MRASVGSILCIQLTPLNINTSLDAMRFTASVWFAAANEEEKDEETKTQPANSTSKSFAHPKWT